RQLPVHLPHSRGDARVELRPALRGVGDPRHLPGALGDRHRRCRQSLAPSGNAQSTATGPGGLEHLPARALTSAGWSSAVAMLQPMTDNGLILNEIAPHSVKRIHLVGVAGTGMGSFAGMLKAAGYEVTGSDTNVYPPMSDMLRAWGIDFMTPYAAENLDRARPDLVIIGNVIRRENPEATAVRERGLRQMSFPAAFGSLMLGGKHSIVITGTHGKTTTSALMAHVLVAAGTDPSFLVGGVTLNYDGNFRYGAGPYGVVEGDEYD